MFLMEKLQVLIRDPGTVVYARSSAYAFDHRLVCQKAFCLLYGIGEFTHENMGLRVAKPTMLIPSKLCVVR